MGGVRPGVVLAVLTLVLPGVAQEPDVRLRLRQRPETVDEIRYHRAFEQKLLLAGQRVLVKSESSQLLRASNGSRSDNGELVRTFKPVRTRVTLVSGTGTLAFDSQGPDAAPDPTVPGGHRIVQALKASSVATRANVYGRDDQLIRVEVRGLDEQRLTPDLKAQWLPASLRQKWIRETQVLPREPVRPDQSWERTSVVPLGRGESVSLKTRYVYKGMKRVGTREFDQITSEVVSVKFSGPAEGPVRVTDAELQPVRSTGEVLFDRQLGRIAQSNSRVQAIGNITFEAHGVTIAGQLDLTLVERKEVEPDGPRE